jgi:hypothetical protein
MKVVDSKVGGSIRNMLVLICGAGIVAASSPAALSAQQVVLCPGGYFSFNGICPQWPSDSTVFDTTGTGGQGDPTTGGDQNTPPVTTTPEPGSAGLILLGLSGLGAVVQTRRKR